MEQLLGSRIYVPAVVSLVRRSYARIFLWVHIVSQFFMWMDEGYYDFRWMSDGWNWVIYFVYTTLIAAFSIAFHRVAFGKSKGSGIKIAASVGFGFVLMAGLLLLLYMNSSWSVYQD